MKENIYMAVCGKFHAFHLASEFAKSDRLAGLYAVDQQFGPPPFVSKRIFFNRWDIKLWRLVATRTFLKYGHSLDRENIIFDRWLFKKLRRLEGGVLHAWNGHAPQTIKQLDPNKWLRCIERSCPHNQFQYDLVLEESKRIGVKLDSDWDESLLEKHIQELYDCDVIISPSRYCAGSYKDPKLIKKLRVNPLGANYTYKDRSKKENGLRVLLVGNDFLRKGTHYLVEAFKLIKDPHAELWIRGVVPTEYLSRIKDSRIKIIPPVTHDRLVELYHQATVFCIPSVDDGFGMVGFEAISFGLPLVYTENCGVGEVLNDSVGICVPIRSPERISAAIQTLAAWRSEDYERFDVARRKILLENTWANCAERMLNNCYVKPV